MWGLLISIFHFTSVGILLSTEVKKIGFKPAASMLVRSGYGIILSEGADCDVK
jgi:hypothetical protein